MRGPDQYIRTFSGRRFWPLDPARPEPLVKAADNVALFFERQILFGLEAAEECMTEDAQELLSRQAGKLNVSRNLIRPLPPTCSEDLFLNRFKKLYAFDKTQAQPG